MTVPITQQHTKLCNNWNRHVHLMVTWPWRHYYRGWRAATGTEWVVHSRLNKLLSFSWIIFNALWIVRTATIKSTHINFFILVEICWEMVILQGWNCSNFMPYFWSIATLILCVHCTNVKYEAHVMRFQICFRDLQSENAAMDNKSVILWLNLKGECINIIELREHLKLCFLIILCSKQVLHRSFVTCLIVLLGPYFGLKMLVARY